jgi:thiol-disulfide isomerase/thioredoxin
VRAAALALLLAPALLAGCNGPAPREVGPLVGNLAPPFTLQPVEAGAAPWALEAHRGRVVLMDLMGVNCLPCRREMPHLLALARAHAGDAGFAMLSVDMASVYPGLGARSLDEIRAFQAEYNATWPFGPDEEGRVGQAYEPIALPTKVVIDAEGVLRAKFTKEITDMAELEEAVAKARPVQEGG